MGRQGAPPPTGALPHQTVFAIGAAAAYVGDARNPMPDLKATLTSGGTVGPLGA